MYLQHTHYYQLSLLPFSVEYCFAVWRDKKINRGNIFLCKRTTNYKIAGQTHNNGRASNICRDNYSGTRQRNVHIRGSDIDGRLGAGWSKRCGSVWRATALHRHYCQPLGESARRVQNQINSDDFQPKAHCHPKAA